MSEARKPSQVAREVRDLIGQSVKTGAAAPARQAMSLLEPMIEGEHDGSSSAKKRQKR